MYQRPSIHKTSRSPVYQMNMNQSKCICDDTGCKDSCPQVFYQGGQPLHLIEREMKADPRVFKLLTDGGQVAEQDNQEKPLFDKYIQQRRALTGGIADAPELSGDECIIDEVLRYSRSSHATDLGNDHPTQDVAPLRQAPKGRTTMRSEEDMMVNNRAVLQRFESLKINGQSIVNATIGGYSMDLEKVAQKARDILPLPAVKLPVIFGDETLTFYQCFFHGMDLLLGRDVIDNIVATQKYFEDDDIMLYPLLAALVGSGYEDDDTEITVFVKRVIQSTFEHPTKPGRAEGPKCLVVVANFWGFEYIEPGMQMREADLKMWLARNHNKYQIVWDNTFKSTGVPSFALLGVQDRYKAGARKIQQYDPTPRLVRASTSPDELYDDEPPHRHSRQRRHRKPAPPSLTDSIFGKRRN